MDRVNRFLVKYYFLFSLVVAVMVITSLSSCKTKYVPVESVHTQVFVKTDTLLQHDSCYVHDSVWSVVKGDTVTNYKWRTQYKDRIIYKVRVDSVAKTDTIVKVVAPAEEAKTKWYEPILQWTLGIALALVGILVLVGFSKYYLGK